MAPLALVAGLAGPLAYSLDTAATAHTGALPSAGPSVTSSGGPGGGGRRAGRRRPAAGSAAGRRRSRRAAGRRRPAGRPGSGAGNAGGPGPGGPARDPAGRATAGRLRQHVRTAGRLPGGQGCRRRIGGGLGGNTQVSSAITKLLTSGAAGYRWAAATVGAESAAPFQLASGEPIMAIGGFNGTDPAPTLAQFKKMVAAHEVHYFIGANGHTLRRRLGRRGPDHLLGQSHFTKQTIGGETIYNLTSPTRT